MDHAAPDASLRFQAITTPGLEEATVGEVTALGGSEIQTSHGSVTFSGPLELGCRATLWLRTVERVRLRVARFHAPHVALLERRLREIDWRPFLTEQRGLDVRVTVHASGLASADLVGRVTREVLGAVSPASESSPSGESPGAATRAPAAGEKEASPAASPRIDVRLVRDTCTLSLDMSGERLDRRGYRLEAGRAPLREHLAAALILTAGWQPDEPFVDPMCGAGTLPIEAGLLAAGVAPGRARRFACEAWPCVEQAAWQAAWRLERDGSARGADAPPAPTIRGSDRNAGQVGVARRNAGRAGVGELIQIERRAFGDLEPPAPRGLLVVNPPYGRRVVEVGRLADLYRELGTRLATVWRGWRRAVVIATREHERQLGLAGTRAVPFRHGGLRCRLLVIEPED